MPSGLWPNSATRKMYGAAGFKKDLKQQKENFTSKIKVQGSFYSIEIEKIKSLVAMFESLPWYKKMWLAFMELFGYKISILKKLK